MTHQGLHSISWIRSGLFLLVWFGGGLWGLDRLSARREISCEPPGAIASCTISEKRLSATRIVKTYPVSDIKFAKETDFSSSFMSPATTTLELHTKGGPIWLFNDDLEGGISKWSAERAINDYLKAKEGPGIRLRASLPSALIATASVFAAISIFLIGGMLFAIRLGRRA